MGQYLLFMCLLHREFKVMYINLDFTTYLVQ